MVYAPRGIGKTFFALETACAVASGQTFLGWKPPKPSKVLYLDGEMPAADFQQRMKAIELSRGSISDEQLMIMTPDLQQAGMLDISRFDHQQILSTIVTNNIDFIYTINGITELAISMMALIPLITIWRRMPSGPLR